MAGLTDRDVEQRAITVTQVSVHAHRGCQCAAGLFHSRGGATHGHRSDIEVLAGNGGAASRFFFITYYWLGWYLFGSAARYPLFSILYLLSSILDPGATPWPPPHPNRRAEPASATSSWRDSVWRRSSPTSTADFSRFRRRRSVLSCGLKRGRSDGSCPASSGRTPSDSCPVAGLVDGSVRESSCRSMRSSGRQPPGGSDWPAASRL